MPPRAKPKPKPKPKAATAIVASEPAAIDAVVARANVAIEAMKKRADAEIELQPADGPLERILLAIYAIGRGRWIFNDRELDVYLDQLDVVEAAVATRVVVDALPNISNSAQLIRGTISADASLNINYEGSGTQRLLETLEAGYDRLDEIRKRLVVRAAGKSDHLLVDGAELSEQIPFERNPVLSALGQLTYRAANKEPLALNGDGYPQQKFSDRGVDVTIEIRPEGAPVRATPEFQEWIMREIVGKVNEHDLDTWIILYANALINADDGGGAYISRRRLLDARGVDRVERVQDGRLQLDGDSTRNSREADASLGRLSSCVLQLEASDPKKRRVTSSSRLLAVTDWHRPPRLPDMGEPSVEGWYYYLSNLTRSGARRSIGLRLERAILKLDPLHDRWAKRIAYFWCNVLKPNDVTLERIGDVLETVRLGSAGKNSKRDRDKFVLAMNRLAKIGAIGGWEYVDGSRNRDATTHLLRGRDHKGWLAEYVRVTPARLRLTAIQ